MNDALWYKDAIIYEVPIRAFADSDGDGIGDFRGLTDKIPYLKELGITAVWVLPFFPSPLRDDGYDVADYKDVNPIYGNLDDCRHFIEVAHANGIHVIIELVMNHTSDRHPWFQRARRAAKGSVERDFYVWSDTSEKYAEARIIFQDFETSNWAWDPVAQAYYWHRFYSHQPDLNFDNPAVQEAIFEVLDFWLAMGVDGLRIDAVPYLFEREGTNCENLPETHAFLKKLRQHIDGKFPNRMLLAEANQWPEDAVQYYGRGDECHMDFHFPLMPRLFMALQMEDSFPIVDILQQTPPIPDNCQWALFLRNHDELTLEMVSDEDRDYMYRVYAKDPQARLNLGIRRRLAPLLGNNRRRLELMNALLFSLPGTPVLYYGDEIGMGDNIYLGDRNGVRTPMQWSGDRNAGFSRANPQKLYAPTIVDPEYHYETVNVESQQANPSSLWWWMKRAIAVRKNHRAFSRGTFAFLHPDNRKVLAFVRSYEGEHILVVANLSRFVQAVRIDLGGFQGMTPVEIFGRAAFPTIDREPYFLSLGPHAFYWFVLTPAAEPAEPTGRVPQWAGGWADLLDDRREVLASLLPTYLQRQRWFGGKGRGLQRLTVTEVLPIGETAALALVQLEYTEGLPESYWLPLSLAAVPGETAIVELTQPQTVYVVEGLHTEAMADFPLTAIAQGQQVVGRGGVLVGQATGGAIATGLPAVPLKAEQSNSSLVYGDRHLFKLYRKAEEGINPEIELGRFLTAQAQPEPRFAAVLGDLTYRRKGQEPIAVGVLLSYIPDAQDGWRYTLDGLRDYFERMTAARPTDWGSPERCAAVPDSIYAGLGPLVGAMEQLGQRTGEMHHCLAQAPDELAPEPFTSFYQRSLYQSVRNLAGQSLRLLRQREKTLLPEHQALAHRILNAEGQVLAALEPLLSRKIGALRIRCHGDYHLGQVLYTGKDFVILDFEGEPARPLGERRMKRSPLRDVAGMVQSLHYAAQTALQREIEGGIEPETGSRYAEGASQWLGALFWRSYRAAAAGILPTALIDMQILLEVYLLEKTLYELAYELNNRPAWVGIPLQRLSQGLQTPLSAPLGPFTV